MSGHPRIFFFLLAPPSVIAGLDPAIHAMTLPLALAGGVTHCPFQPRQFF